MLFLLKLKGRFSIFKILIARIKLRLSLVHWERNNERNFSQ